MISGILNVDKEAEYTSHDVVACLRRIFRQKRIGHAGTLDPMATGVLPVCLGKATRMVEAVSGTDKTYETILRLGKSTDTQDITGVVLAERPVICSVEEVQAVLQRFCGVREQIPPMFSAKKVKGKRLYELARDGREIERKPAQISITELTMLSAELPQVRLRVTCSKGTYIRTLCHEIGEALGCGGCMEALVRIRVGTFLREEAHTLAEIESAVEKGQMTTMLLAPDAFYADLPIDHVVETAADLAHNGNGIPIDALRQGSEPERGMLRLYDATETFLGIYQRRNGTNIFFPKYFFYEKEEERQG